VFNHNTFRTLLESRNIKQVQLSQITGIPRNSICRYVSGEVQPKADKIKLLAEALGVGMDSLVVSEPLEMTIPPKRKLCFCPNCGVNLKGVEE